MIVVTGTVTAGDPSAFDALRGAMETMLTETRKEDGCIHYIFAIDILDPAVMVISEAWRDAEALGAHAKSAHMAEWRKAVGGAGMVGRDLKMYQADEGTAI
ncbi:MAG: antibiotic biosynthesis monooxygenase [Sphingomonadales bacterium]|nr:antibiotic biosynthesis monooxygenase [Sphingomonadales bacterium]MDE2568352.1 antibiotic biosynthesis monooxygenase [Sphingomonadales bacterium]